MCLEFACNHGPVDHIQYMYMYYGINYIGDVHV